MQIPTTFSELTRYRHALAIGVIIYAAFFPPTIKAVAISLDLGPAGNITSEVVTSFSALNGLSLAGQNISLDFTFTNAEFVRLFTLTSESFSTLLTLQTSGTGLVGFLDGTGFLSDQNGIHFTRHKSWAARPEAMVPWQLVCFPFSPTNFSTHSISMMCISILHSQ